MKTFDQIINKFEEIVNFAPMVADCKNQEVISRHVMFSGYDREKNYLQVQFYICREKICVEVAHTTEQPMRIAKLIKAIEPLLSVETSYKTEIIKTVIL